MHVVSSEDTSHFYFLAFCLVFLRPISGISTSCSLVSLIGEFSYSLYKSLNSSCSFHMCISGFLRAMATSYSMKPTESLNSQHLHHQCSQNWRGRAHSPLHFNHKASSPWVPGRTLDFKSNMICSSSWPLSLKETNSSNFSPQPETSFSASGSIHSNGTCRETILDDSWVSRQLYRNKRRLQIVLSQNSMWW